LTFGRMNIQDVPDECLKDRFDILPENIIV